MAEKPTAKPRQRKEPKPRSITEQYKLSYCEVCYDYASDYFKTMGLDFSQILKDKYDDPAFSRWKNRLHPFDLAKLALAMEPYDVNWGDVGLPDAKTLKRKCLAKTIETMGQLDGKIKSPFGDEENVEILKKFVVASSAFAKKFANKVVTEEFAQSYVFNDLVMTCPRARKLSLVELQDFVKVWGRYYGDAVQELSESFRDEVLELNEVLGSRRTGVLAQMVCFFQEFCQGLFKSDGRKHERP